MFGKVMIIFRLLDEVVCYDGCVNYMRVVVLVIEAACLRVFYVLSALREMGREMV